MTDKYLLTSVYHLSFIIEICFLAVFTFPSFQLCYPAFPSYPEEARASMGPVWQVFRHGDLLSVRAVHEDSPVSGGDSGHRSRVVILWVRCDPLLGLLWLGSEGDSCHYGGAARAEQQQCINGVEFSQLVYL